MPVLKNVSTGQIIAEHVRVAETWWERLAGFIPKAQVDPDEGLWFPDCWLIHTLGMRARIDVLFLKKDGRIARIARNAPRQRAAIACFGARNVVELGAGALDGRDVLVGDRVILE